MGGPPLGLKKKPGLNLGNPSLIHTPDTFAEGGQPGFSPEEMWITFSSAPHQKPCKTFSRGLPTPPTLWSKHLNCRTVS